MTNSEKLAMLKALLGTTSLSDDTLLVYLGIAGNKVIRRSYQRITDTRDYTVPEMYEDVQVELARNEIRKIGADGQSSMSDNGVSRVYESEDVLLRRIIPVVRVPGVVPDETT